MPVCKTNLLDKREFLYEKLDGAFFNSFQSDSLTPYWGKCRLLNYTVKKVVSCFDALYQEHIRLNSLHQRNVNEDPTMLHFVFIGDSRIRQQYYNFLQVSLFD